jgi:hypothetical protein
MKPGDESNEASGQPVDLESLQRHATALEAQAAIADVLYQYAQGERALARSLAVRLILSEDGSEVAFAEG